MSFLYNTLHDPGADKLKWNLLTNFDPQFRSLNLLSAYYMNADLFLISFMFPAIPYLKFYCFSNRDNFNLQKKPEELKVHV